MEWTNEAESAIKKVPFFVRKRVKTRVEKEALAEGKHKITIMEVKATQKRYLTNMSAEIKGYQIDTCFGAGGCPNKVTDSEQLFRKIEMLLKQANLLGFLKRHVEGDLKFHHEFRISLADCPNACSQPQIKDIGIIAASEPLLAETACTLCNECVNVCKENAIRLNKDEEIPEIDMNSCVRCGQCIEICPSGTIGVGKEGYRVLIGGKLGRHPRLARELPFIYNDDETIKIVKNCIDFYKKNSTHGKRFSEILKDKDIMEIDDI